ncbi:MAG: Maf family protein [Puniceicoccales bacterium]
MFDTLILASTSPRRRHLLEQAGLRFAVDPAQVEEHEDPASCPRETVLHNARIKAAHVSERRPEALVLGSDTVVALDDEVLHKPADMDAARAMLRRLASRTHTVYTGVCLLGATGRIDECHAVTSAVTFKPLDDEAITRYFSLVNPLDKAGAYGIQEGKDMIIAGLEGSLNNVMGLPTEFLLDLLDRLHLLEKLRLT